MTAFETEDSLRFAQWALQTLRCQLQSSNGSICEASLPADLQADWDGAASVRFRAGANVQASHESTASPAEQRKDANLEDGLILDVDPASRLFQWIVEKLDAMGPATHAAPASQPTSVHEMSLALFSAFEFEQGHIYLAGCSLEDRPLVRVSTVQPDENASGQLQHFFFWPDGEPVDDATISLLQLQQLILYPGRPPEQAPTSLANWVGCARRKLDEDAGQFVVATIIWCKYAQGKLAFRADGHEDPNKEIAVEVPFADWASALASGAAQPAAYHCPLSNCDTYRLSVTDDGRIAAAEAIQVCEVSGQRVLVDELERCSVTGKLVLPEFCNPAPVPVSWCCRINWFPAQCDQSVSPASLKGGRCSACRSLVQVRKEDPRMARLLDEYPKLDRCVPLANC